MLVLSYSIHSLMLYNVYMDLDQFQIQKYFCSWDLHVETVDSQSVPIEQDPSVESQPEDNYLSIPPSSVHNPLADFGVSTDSNLISDLLTPMINDMLHFNSLHPRPPLRRSSRIKFKPIDYMSFHRDGKK